MSQTGTHEFDFPDGRLWLCCQTDDTGNPEQGEHGQNVKHPASDDGFGEEIVIKSCKLPSVYASLDAHLVGRDITLCEAQVLNARVRRLELFPFWLFAIGASSDTKEIPRVVSRVFRPVWLLVGAPFAIGRSRSGGERKEAILAAVGRHRRAITTSGISTVAVHSG